MIFSLFSAKSLFLIFLLFPFHCQQSGILVSDKVPTDNPIATYYNGNEGYPGWTDEIRWDNAINMGTYTNGSHDFARFENGQDELYAQGGGLLYYPPGDYNFSAMPADGYNGRGLMLKTSLVIRYAIPVGDKIARNDGNLDLQTTFKFPFQNKAGGEVPRDCNIIGLMPTEDEYIEDASNVGLVWVNFVGGTVWWGVDREWGETWATADGLMSDRVKVSWANRLPDGTHPKDAFAGSPTSGTKLGIGKDRLVFGSSFTDSAVINNSLSDDTNMGASKATEVIAVGGRYAALALTSPNSLGVGVIVDEDFTSGAFTANTASYWTINGSGINFRAPHDRNFDIALSNRIAEGGGSFADNLVFSIPDAETTHPSGRRQFGINKLDEVAVVRYQTFSDIAKNSREQFHLQVAMVQTDPELNPSPDFGHDLSLETESRFVSLSETHSDRVQLTANVENKEIDGNNPHKEAQKQAHFEATMTAADLDKEYTNLVIWRDRPGTGTTNIEQWGNNRLGDYNVPSEMVNRLPRNQDPNYSLFNEIEVFLQRGGTNVDLLRKDVHLNDAQIGMTNLHVSITKKTDFNLDYRTDAADFIRWNIYQNLGGTPTMQTGDADNDGDVDNDDLAQLQLYLGQIHDPNFSTSQSVYTYNPESALNSDYIIPNGSEEEPIFAYNKQTGELLVNTKGQALNAWIIRGQVANSVEPINNGNWWMQTVGDTQQWIDLDLDGFSSTELTLIATFAPGLNLTDFGKVEVGFRQGGGKLVDVVANNITMRKSLL